MVKNVNNIKTTDTSDLAGKNDYMTRVNEIENNVNDHDDSNKYITTQGLNRSTSYNFAARLK